MPHAPTCRPRCAATRPTARPTPPSSPVIILALTSKTRSPGQIYDEVSNLVQQKIAQVPGVGDVELGGGSLPAVRVELLPFALNRYGVSMEDVRAALQASNANRPKGAIEGNGQRLQIYSGASTASGGRKAAGLPRTWSSPGATTRRSGCPMWPKWLTVVENTNTLGCSTAARRWWCWSRASPTPM